MIDKIIDAKEKVEFNSIFEAINATVGTNYTSWMKATWSPDSNDKRRFRIWFPKLAKMKNGQYVPAANKCLNFLSNDWNELVYDDLNERDTVDEEHYCGYDLIFAKEENGGYIFRGVFVRDEEKSSLNHHVSKRVATRVKMIGTPAYDIELLDSVEKASKTINDPIPPKDILKSNSGYTYICGRCGSSFIAAKRCSECGQLVLSPETELLPPNNNEKLYFNPDETPSNIVTELIRYMEAKGLVFSSKVINASGSYGILKGKSSIGYRKEGIVMYCAKDEIDKNSIVSVLKLPVYKNSQATRPYKLVLTESEFVKAVELLKKNENNCW